MATGNGNGKEKNKKTLSGPPIKINFLRRSSLEDRIRIIRYIDGAGGILKKAQMAWKKELKTEPPHKVTFKHILDKFNETGSVADRAQIPSKRKTYENQERRVQFIRNTLTDDPTTRFTSIAEKLGVTSVTVSNYRKDNRMHFSRKNPFVTELKKKIAEVEKKIAIAEGRKCIYVRRKNKVQHPSTSRGAAPTAESEVASLQAKPIITRAPRTRTKVQLPPAESVQLPPTEPTTRPPRVKSKRTDGLPSTEPNTRAPRTKPNKPTNSRVRIPKSVVESHPRISGQKIQDEVSSSSSNSNSPCPEIVLDDESETEGVEGIPSNQDLQAEHLTFSLPAEEFQIAVIDHEEVDEGMIDNLEIYEMTEEEFNQINTAGELGDS